MNLKMLQRTITVISLLSLFAFGRPIYAEEPITGAGNVITPINTSTSTGELEIPSINLQVPVVVAHFSGNTWDFSNLNDAAGFFEGLPMPGDGSNAVIG